MHVLAQVSTTDPVVTVAGLAGLSALILKVIDFLRLLVHFSTNKSGVITQLLVWIGGIASVVLFASTDFGNSVTISGVVLDKATGATLVLIGIMLGSAASVIVDFKQSIDSSDSASKPPLLK
jgi:hypothetical protein